MASKIFQKSCLMIAIASVVFSSDCVGQVNMGGEHIMTNTIVNDNIHGYYSYLPDGYDPDGNKRYPLYIFIHGLGKTGDGSAQALHKLYDRGELWGGVISRLHDPDYYGYAIPKSFTVNNQTFEYIYVCPQFIAEPVYNGGISREIKDINDFIDYCVEHYRVDASRIYLAGQSSGGAYIVDYLSSGEQNASRIAAALFTSAAGIIQPDKAWLVTTNRIGTWFGAATADPSAWNPAYYAQENVNNINGATPAPSGIYVPKLTIFTDPNVDHGFAASRLFDPNYVEAGLSTYKWLLQFSAQGPLPVTGLELSVAFNSPDVAIRWSASSEINSSTYSVERSVDAVDFEMLTTVFSKNSASGASYSYVDSSPKGGVNYYRIKQTDLNGRVTYSNIKSVTVTNNVKLTVFPNPARNLITIEAGTPVGREATLRVYDNTGRLYKMVRLDNSRTHTINVVDLPTGLFIGKILRGKKEPLYFNFLKE